MSLTAKKVSSLRFFLVIIVWFFTDVNVYAFRCLNL